eukprot:scaffold7724_cov248-Pinguiococcus_pyrenoidosus.AAC.3
MDLLQARRLLLHSLLRQPTADVAHPAELLLRQRCAAKVSNPSQADGFICHRMALDASTAAELCDCVAVPASPVTHPDADVDRPRLQRRCAKPVLVREHVGSGEVDPRAVPHDAIVWADHDRGVGHGPALLGGQQWSDTEVVGAVSVRHHRGDPVQAVGVCAVAWAERAVEAPDTLHHCECAFASGAAVLSQEGADVRRRLLHEKIAVARQIVYPRDQSYGVGADEIGVILDQEHPIGNRPRRRQPLEPTSARLTSIVAGVVQLQCPEPGRDLRIERTEPLLGDDRSNQVSRRHWPPSSLRVLQRLVRLAEDFDLSEREEPGGGLLHPNYFDRRRHGGGHDDSRHGTHFLRGQEGVPVCTAPEHLDVVRVVGAGLVAEEKNVRIVEARADDIKAVLVVLRVVSLRDRAHGGVRSRLQVRGKHGQLRCVPKVATKRDGPRESDHGAWGTGRRHPTRHHATQSGHGLEDGLHRFPRTLASGAGRGVLVGAHRDSLKADEAIQEPWAGHDELLDLVADRLLLPRVQHDRPRANGLDGKLHLPPRGLLLVPRVRHRASRVVRIDDAVNRPRREA